MSTLKILIDKHGYNRPYQRTHFLWHCQPLVFYPKFIDDKEIVHGTLSHNEYYKVDLKKNQCWTYVGSDDSVAPNLSDMITIISDQVSEIKKEVEELKRKK